MYTCMYLRKSAVSTCVLAPNDITVAQNECKCRPTTTTKTNINNSARPFMENLFRATKRPSVATTRKLSAAEAESCKNTLTLPAQLASR